MPRKALKILMIACLAGTAFSAPHADKLVTFRNGRVMRVLEVRQDEGWYFLSLGKRSEIGIPEGLIAEITEAAGEGGETLANVQASAGGRTATPVTRVRRPPTARPAGAIPARGVNTGGQAGAGTVQPGRPGLTEAARARAEAMRGRILGGEAGDQLRSNLPNAAPQQESPAGQELAGGNTSWPSLLNRGRAGGQPPAQPDAQKKKEFEEDNR